MPGTRIPAVLTPADEALVARDPRVPGLAAVLDAAPTIGALAPHWQVDSLHTTYLRYKPGTSLVVALRMVTVDGRTHDVQLAAYGPGAGDKMAKAHRRGEAGLGVVTDHERGLVLADALTDRHLPGLRYVPADVPDATVVPLRYKPARRWVGRVTDASSSAIVKVHRPVLGREAARRHRLFERDGLPVPRLLDSPRRRGVVRTEFHPGVSLEEHRPGYLAGEVGALLARLHGSATSSAVGPVDVAARLEAALAAIEAVVPALGGTARATARSVLRVLAENDRRGLVHGDLSPDQLLARADGAGLLLLDLDRAGIDDPMADLASYAAAEFTAGRAAAGADPREVMGGVLESYARAGGRVDEAALIAGTAGALLQRAIDPFRHRQPAWPRTTAELVTSARRLARIAETLR